MLNSLGQAIWVIFEDEAKFKAPSEIFLPLTACNLYSLIEDDRFYVFNFLEFSASNPFVFAILHT